MAHISIRDLRKVYGVSQDDIDLARATRAAQKKAGAAVLPRAVICGVQARRRTAGVDTSLEARQLRRLGRYDQAALLADRAALAERSPERAMMAREAARTLRDLSASQQLEFDFFGGGNVSIAHQYQDAVTERLFEAAPTTTKAKEALALLTVIIRHLGWQTYECTKTAADLCALTRTNKTNMSMAIALLEEVGAIRRVRRGRVKVITVTPEGAFRGDVHEHAKTVERYRLDVIKGGRPPETGA